MPDELITTPSFRAFDDRAEVASPVVRKHLPALRPEIRVVQISEVLDDDEYETVARWLAPYPDVWLRVYAAGPDGGYAFLKRFQAQRRFSLAAWTTEALELLPDETVGLWLEYPRSRAVRGASKETVAPLGRLHALREIHVEGPAKALETIGSLRTLEELRFRSCKLGSLDAFTKLDRVHTLEIRLGSLADAAALSRIGHLRYLELWRITGFDDARPVAELSELQHLFLQSLPKITAFPSMKKMKALRRVTIDGMKGLTDLSALCDAPVLEDLVVIDCPQLREEHFRPLVGHPTLRHAHAGTGSLKRNAAIQSMLGLPDTGEFVFRDS